MTPDEVVKELNKEVEELVNDLGNYARLKEEQVKDEGLPALETLAEEKEIIAKKEALSTAISELQEYEKMKKKLSVEN